MNFVPWWKVNLGENEIERVKNSIRNRSITQGPVTEELERCLAETLDIPFVILVTSGSMALLAALVAFGVGPGDEVIVPDLTFVATAQAPLILGAKVKLVDVEPEKLTIDLNKVKKSITKKTKVIIPVHLNGRAANIEGINKLADEYNIRVIEDTVQAFYSKNSFGYLGTQSDIGVFSLGVTKIITAVQGGFLATRDKAVFEKLKKIRNHGLSPEENYDIFGFNFKFNDVLAGIGLTQIRKLGKKIETQKYNYKFYRNTLKKLKHIKMIDVNIEKGEIPLWIEVYSKKRQQLISLLANQGIQAKPFYPNLNKLSYLNSNGNFKYSEFYSSYGLTLPSGHGQSRQDLKRVVKALEEIDSIFENEIKNK